MGKYGLSKCPVFKETGDAYETSPFGEPRGSYTHKGVDLVRNVGYNTTATIVVIASGTVTAVKNTVTGVDHVHNVEGNYVVVDHGGGMVSKYYHLKYGSIPAGIRKGVTVKAGDTLGFMGNTGDSTGAHLHFQLEQDGKPIDPKPYITGQKVIGGAAKSQLERDLDVLVSHGVIKTPEYWQQTAPKVQYLSKLIHNMAEVLQ